MNISKILRESIFHVLNEGQEMTPEQQRFIQNCDPTEDKKYGKWILKNWGQISTMDSNTVIAMLSDFDENKKNLPSMGFNSNIQELTPSDMEQIHVAINNMRNRKLSVSTYNNLKNYEGQYDVLLRGQDCVVVYAKTWDADRFFGSNTSWCTVGSESFFNTYHPDGYYIILPIENGKVNLKSNRRIQFHPSIDMNSETWELYAMDVEDSPLSYEDIVEWYPEAKAVLRELEQKIPQEIKEKKAAYNIVQKELLRQIVFAINHEFDYVLRDYDLECREGNINSFDDFCYQVLSIDDEWAFNVEVRMHYEPSIELVNTSKQIRIPMVRFSEEVYEEDMYNNLLSNASDDSIRRYIQDNFDIESELNESPIRYYVSLFGGFKKGLYSIDEVSPTAEFTISKDGYSFTFEVNATNRGCALLSLNPPTKEDEGNNLFYFMSTGLEREMDDTGDVIFEIQEILKSYKMYKSDEHLIMDSKFIREKVETRRTSGIKFENVSAEKYVCITMCSDTYGYNIYRRNGGFSSKSFQPCRLEFCIFHDENGNVEEVSIFEDRLSSIHPYFQQSPQFEITQTLESEGLVTVEPEVSYGQMRSHLKNPEILPQLLDRIADFIDKKYGIGNFEAHKLDNIKE